MIGEIIDGELHVQPRPSPKHAKVSSDLSTIIGYPYRFGRGGPGGWIFLYEVEIQLGEHTMVPDMVGWRKERFPKSFETNWIEVVPDWILEILSPGAIRLDKTKKMPIYARHGVKHLWLINPMEKSLDAFMLAPGGWLPTDSFAENDKTRAEPFMEVEIDLAELWLE